MPDQRIKWREIYWSKGLKDKQGLIKAPKEAKEVEARESKLNKSSYETEKLSLFN